MAAKFGVVVFPGSNCDRDMQYSLEHDLGKEVVMLWHKDDKLPGFTTNDCVVLPGGFSYGDYLRCGAIARFSPIMQAVKEFAEKGGKVLGVCNGFQILCEAGLLPGALLQNNHQLFNCKNVYLKNPLNQIKKIPIAHGDGRYFATTEVLDSLNKNKQIIYTYCNEKGELSEASNPNGSINHIAGIQNEHGNVYGMMPHPERATSMALGNTDGISIFKELNLI
jgi:phosphoribosylformylglycinamidine synthase subunit PurQ / glutaminase